MQTEVEVGDTWLHLEGVEGLCVCACACVGGGGGGGLMCMCVGRGNQAMVCFHGCSLHKLHVTAIVCHGRELGCLLWVHCPLAAGMFLYH